MLKKILGFGKIKKDIYSGKEYIVIVRLPLTLKKVLYFCIKKEDSTSAIPPQIYLL